MAEMAEANKQVSMTSLGDDVRETLAIAGLEKDKERSLDNTYVCVKVGRA